MSAAANPPRPQLVVEGTVTSDFVTMSLAGQLFGIAVLDVQDVLASHRTARIPLAPDWVAGALNLRGRIVTAINLRRKLGLPDCATDSKQMSIVIERHGELYSLLVDEVGEVLSVAEGSIGPNPPTLDALWRSVSSGIVRLDDRLLAILDVAKVFEAGDREREAA